MLTCATPVVLGLSVTVGRCVQKPFCRAGRPTERDLRKQAELSHLIDTVGGDMRGYIMYPPPYPPFGELEFHCANVYRTRISFVRDCQRP